MGCGTSQQNIKNVELISNDIYQRRELIGVGHHGRVYKSFYQLDKKQYANKIIDQFKVSMNVKNMQANYSQLVSRLQKLRHQKIATYFHFQFNDKEISIIMELSKQGTLKKFIQKNGPSKESSAANIIENVLEALDYLHCAGFIHKDLKSSNVLLMPKEQIKLSDYAIAEIYDDRLSVKDKKKSKITTQIDFYRAQSLPYMAPQVVKNIQITEKSDVWSVGCILLQLLTGKIPWTDCADNFQQAFKILSSGVISPIPSQNLSGQCKNFLQGCLAVIPTQRLSIKQLLKHKFIKVHSKNDTLLFELNQQDFLNRQINQKDKNEAKKSSKHVKSISTYDNISNSNRYLKDSIQKDKQYNQSTNGRSKTRLIQQNFAGMKQSLRLIQSRIESKKQQSLNRQDIKPIIQEQPYTVIINNKKVKLQPYKFKNSKLIGQPSSKTIHQMQQWASPVINKEREKTIISKNSYQFKDNNSNIQNSLTNRNRSNSHYEDSLDAQLKVKNLRVQTQPYSSENFDKDYFKKPLKLLKKKLKQNKQLSDFSRKLSQITSNKASVSNNNISQFITSNINQQPQPYEPFQSSKIRIKTETRRQQIVINTQLARAERDRYINEQKLIKKMRQQQKSKWQEQLKKGAQVLKSQMNKFYYPQIKINLKN